jgi:hypothetical protein
MADGEKLSLQQVRAFLEAGGEVRFQAKTGERFRLGQSDTAAALRPAQAPAQRTCATLPGEDDQVEPSEALDWMLPAKRRGEAARLSAANRYNAGRRNLELPAAAEDATERA